MGPLHIPVSAPLLTGLAHPDPETVAGNAGACHPQLPPAHGKAPQAENLWRLELLRQHAPWLVSLLDKKKKSYFWAEQSLRSSLSTASAAAPKGVTTSSSGQDADDEDINRVSFQQGPRERSGPQA